MGGSGRRPASDRCRFVFGPLLWTVAFYCAGVFRLFAIVTHEPMLGMANNYDQIRAMSELGVSPQDASVKFGQQSMNRPIRFFIRALAAFCE